MRDQQVRLAILMELLWWGLSLLLAGVVLYPIWDNVQDYPFWGYNFLYIILFITYSRYLFQLRHTWLAGLFWVKLIFIFTAIPVTFLLIEGINTFQVHLDEVGIESFLGHLQYDQQSSMATYIRTQMLFFGTGAVITSAIWPLRLVISIWRMRNRGTV